MFAENMKWFFLLLSKFPFYKPIFIGFPLIFLLQFFLSTNNYEVFEICFLCAKSISVFRYILVTIVPDIQFSIFYIRSFPFLMFTSCCITTITVNMDPCVLILLIVLFVAVAFETRLNFYVHPVEIPCEVVRDSCGSSSKRNMASF